MLRNERNADGSRCPARRTLGGYIWFALMIGGWSAFFSLLLFSESTLGDLWHDLRNLPLVVEGLVWLLLVPLVLATAVWELLGDMAARASRQLLHRRVVTGVLASEEDCAMRVLVSAASKYGATEEIAEAIGRRLRERGLETDVRSIGDVDDVARFEAVVLGSAVYAGHWLESARDFVDRYADELARRPTWLFSSGPIGDPPRPSEQEAVQIESIMAATRAREHRVFAGKLDKSRLTFPERALVFAFRAAEGDFRDWEAIARWANEIADVLEGTDAVAGG